MLPCPNTNIKGFNHAVYTLLRNPSQLLPHLSIPNFTHLPETLGPHLVAQPSPPQPCSSDTISNQKHPPAPIIRALVLDKDNTLCAAHTTTFPPSVLAKLTSLRTSPSSPFHLSTNPHAILIVSNRAGSHPAYEAEALVLEAKLKHLQIPVFRLPQHDQHGATTASTKVEKKPFCGAEVVDWFRARGVVESAHEIAVVGDRLGTDVLMAAKMGAWSVWCRDGVAGLDAQPQQQQPSGPVIVKRGLLETMELWVERYLRVDKGLTAPPPKGWVEESARRNR